MSNHSLYVYDMELQMENSLLDQLLAETRQSKKHTDKLEQINKAAIELFSEKGFSNTSTKEIAIRAKVAEGTIFKHYGTKENLLLNLMLKFIQVFIPVIKEDLKQKLEKQYFKDMSSFLNYFIKERIEFILGNHDIFKVFVKEILYNDALRNNFKHLHFNDVETMFYHYFDIFKKNGELDDIENEIILKHMLKIVLTDAIWVFALSDQYKTLDVEKWTEKLIYEFLHGVSSN